MGDGTQTPQGDGQQDARYTLEGIELDEGYFSVASKSSEEMQGYVAGAEGKQNVAVMAESTRWKISKRAKGETCAFISRPGTG